MTMNLVGKGVWPILLQQSEIRRAEFNILEKTISYSDMNAFPEIKKCKKVVRKWL